MQKRKKTKSKKEDQEDIKKRRNQVSEDIEQVIEAHCGFVEEIMDYIYISKFWTKCSYCEMELQYPTFFLNDDRSCSICGEYFIMKNDQGNSQMQSQKLEAN